MISLIKSSFFEEEKTKQALAGFVLKAEKFSMGSECKAFEEKFAKKQERKYAVFVGNGSLANLLLIQALLNLGQLKKDYTVGISALTWATNVMPLLQLGLNPFALDCELETLNVSSKILKKEVDKLDAVFLTNVLGLCCDIGEIEALLEKRGKILIEDNCESLGSRHKGKLLGNFGLASTFSFFVGHHLSTIEGGMICTDNDDLYEMLIMGRAHGWDRNLSEASQKKLRAEFNVDDFFSKYTFYELAYNARPTEISGVLGNQQIQYWDTIVSRRERNFHKFQATIEKNPELIALRVSMDLISNFAMPLIVKNKKNFEKYKQHFIQNNVEIRPIIAGNITKQPFYRKYAIATNCSNSDYIHENGFYFPNNPELTDEEVLTLCRLLES